MICALSHNWVINIQSPIWLFMILTLHDMYIFDIFNLQLLWKLWRKVCLNQSAENRTRQSLGCLSSYTHIILDYKYFSQCQPHFSFEVLCRRDATMNRNINFIFPWNSKKNQIQDTLENWKKKKNIVLPWLPK